MMSNWTATIESLYEILGKYLSEKRSDSYYYGKKVPGIAGYVPLREDY